MAHTSTFTVNDVEYAIIHNGDWSGLARIIPQNGPNKNHEVGVPGKLLTAIGRQAALDEVVSMVETMMGGEPKPPAAPRLVVPSEGPPVPIPVILTCPSCNARHIDVGEFATRVHHTHSCQTCGLTWRPAIVPTVGVQFLQD